MIDHTAALSGHDRLAAIAAFDLDSPDLRRRLDELSARTAHELQFPVALVTLVLDSAQLIAGSTALPGWIADVQGQPVEWAFCSHAVVTGAPYLLPDAEHDPVQHHNPLVVLEGVGSYAGVPLRTSDGHVLGAHCVLDMQPHGLTPGELAGLEAAGAEAVAILEEYRLPV